MEPITVTHNKARQRYEVLLPDGDHAVIAYEMMGDKMGLMHTVVPEAHEGKGIAGTMAKFALEEAKEQGIKVLPYCPYIQTYVKRHPEYNDIIATME
jgi:hypothetical protein